MIIAFEVLPSHIAAVEIRCDIERKKNISLIALVVGKSPNIIHFICWIKKNDL